MYQRALSLIESASTTNAQPGHSRGEVWAALGFCALMLDDLNKSYAAYQQALLSIGTVLDPMIWYGIGMLYDRYGSDEHALEAFGLAVKLLDRSKVIVRNGGKLVRDIHYRLGGLFRNRRRFDLARQCFAFAAQDPPSGLTAEDVALQEALVEAARGGLSEARDRVERLAGNVEGKRAAGKFRMHLAWLSALAGDLDGPVSTLAAVVEEDPGEGLAWYYLGRVHVMREEAVRAYEAFQQAVYRDGRNAAFWNSIGILYFATQQYRDALDAFSRAIQHGPFVADIWWNLGVLYETCNGQLVDAADAYQRASELADTEAPLHRIRARLALVRAALSQQAGPPSLDGLRVLEIDPLPFLARPVILNGGALPPQRPTTALPPGPKLPAAATAAPGSHAPRLPLATPATSQHPGHAGRVMRPLGSGQQQPGPLPSHRPQ